MTGKATIELRLLGGFDLRVRGSEVRLRSRKAQLLLARLGLEPRGVPREALADMLWGSREPEHARQSLRRALADLRLALGPSADALESDGELVRLDRNALLCDAHDLEAAASGDADDGSVELGTLLPAATPDELGAQAWLDRERARVAQLCSSVLDRRIEAAMAAHDFAAAERHVLDALAIEPTREGLHRTLMRIHAGRGEPSRALKQFGALRALLERELGVRPEPASIDLYERIRAARAQPRMPDGGGTASLARVEGDEASLAEDGNTTGRDARAAEAIPLPEQTIHFCRAADGATLAYAALAQDGATGPPVLKAANWMSHLEHEWDSPVWRHWIAALSHRWPLVRYDQRGNGLSDWDVDDLSFEAMVADLEAVADAAIAEPFVLVGISQGCAVSAAYAHRHPERVRGLVLYGGYVRGWRARADPHEIARREAMETLILEGWGQDMPAFRQMFTSLFIPDGGPDEMDWFNEMQRVSVSPETAVRLSEAFGMIDVSACLPEIRAPTLVAHTRGDLVCPLAGGRELAASIPGARFITLESANHILLANEPAFHEFERQFQRFVLDID